MDTLKITLSNPYFYQIVLNKYQKTRKNLFRLPAMIFHRSRRNILSQKINIYALIQLNSNFQNTLTSLTANSVKRINMPFSWFKIEKFLSKFLSIPVHLKRMQSTETVRYILLVPIVTSIKSAFSRSGNITLSLKRSLQQTRSNLKQVNSGILESSLVTGVWFTSKLEKVNSRLLGSPLVTSVWFRSKLEKVNSRLLGSPLVTSFWSRSKLEKVNSRHNSASQNLLEKHTVFMQESPAISSKGNFSLINMTMLYNKKDPITGTNQKSAILIKPVFINYHNKSDTSDRYLQKRDALMDNDSFYFHSQQKIEQAIDHVKRLAEETKSAVMERSMQYSSGNMDASRQADINRISDKVYQMIDCRLKIEKERRGYF